MQVKVTKKRNDVEMRFKQFKLEDVGKEPIIWLKVDVLISPVDMQMYENNDHFKVQSCKTQLQKKSKMSTV